MPKNNLIRSEAGMNSAKSKSSLKLNMADNFNEFQVRPPVTALKGSDTKGAPKYKTFLWLILW